MSPFQYQVLKPVRLAPGDRVAAISPSWGGPSVLPEWYKFGKQQLEQVFGVEVVEMPHTLAPAEWVASNPAARASDMLEAFRDPTVKGVIATIGGSDAIRLIPHLDLDVIRENPKVFLGYSDTTALHFACLAAGIVSFYGPSIMSGFAENGGMHEYTINGVRRAIFSSDPIGQIPLNEEGWTTEKTDWSDVSAQTQPRQLQPPTTPRILQGKGTVAGRLIGGCSEVLEMLKGTVWWPPMSVWTGAILFYETSEDAPPANFIRYWLRNFAAQGILKVLNGILIARPDPAGDESYQTKIEQVFVDVLAEEGLSHLPVLSGLDFGHTQPMATLPYGIKAQIDCNTARLTVLEASTRPPISNTSDGTRL
ncbi:S66 peptidase family protein [Rhizobium sp. BK376]|uniref:S66 family peptidase n=1 Tax=Rhizobium sp. BK376 TaxID=2512149 RepID=UPI001051146C|nr:S66 peptidase family protein [Rhizobium sp. BK376]TCR65770.1 muramoyltetrapeptide carboxypeptidase LdcA involved in peptidoglycan recycling [Rhizobium sp. BK376]